MAASSDKCPLGTVSVWSPPEPDPERWLRRRFAGGPSVQENTHFTEDAGYIIQRHKRENLWVCRSNCTPISSKDLNATTLTRFESVDSAGRVTRDPNEQRVRAHHVAIAVFEVVAADGDRLCL